MTLSCKNICRLHLLRSEHRDYADASNTDAVADIKSQANTVKYRVTAVITEEKVQSGNFLIILHT
jgi:hypothetical protein